MLTRFAITRRADDDGVDSLVAERDYVLSHIVAQLHRAKPAGGQLIFKGGTALRLVHIGDYRYSADLDFTIIGASASVATASMVEVLDAARIHAGFPLLELSTESNRISYVGPLDASKPRILKLDISTPRWSRWSSSAQFSTQCGLISPMLFRSPSTPLTRLRRRSCAASSNVCNVEIYTAGIQLVVQNQ